MKKKTALIGSLCVGVLACVIGGSIGFRTPSETVIANAQVVDGFTILEQAAVRRSEPNGIRFTVNLTDSAYSEIGASATYGTLMLPADLLAEGEELTLETSQVLNVPTTTWQEVGERYTSALVGEDKNGDGIYDSLGESYYNRPIVARGYAKMGDTVYYTENSAIRSIGYIATMAQAVDNDSSQLITDIVNKTDVEFVLNEAGKIAAGSADNTGLLYNTLDNSSDAVAAIKVGGITVPSQYVNIQYSVGDSGIATVNGQTITAVSAGTTSLTATCMFNGKEYTLNTTLSTENFVGASEYSILLSSDATSVETTAANRLQSIVKEATGAVLPIVAESGNETTTDKYISIGATSLAAKQTFVVDSDKATATAFKTVDNTLFIIANSNEAVSYGVDELLDKLVNYEYYAKDTYSFTAPKSAIAMPTDEVFEPAIEYIYAGNGYLNEGKNDDVRQGLRMDRWYKDFIRFGGDFLHNSLSILDPEIYQDSHSEWYVMDKEWSWSDFKYVYTPMQLCYTAGGDTSSYNTMVSTAATKIYEGFAAEPTKTKVSFSIMDTLFTDDVSFACTCDACADMGNNSDTILSFVSDLCKAVETKFTEANDNRKDTFKIVTLAYLQAFDAPTNTTDMNEHIEVWIAPIEANFTKPLNGENDSVSELQVFSYENIVSWGNLLKQTDNDCWIWLYSSSIYNLFAPFNSFGSVRENYKIAVDNGVDYMYNLGAQAQSSWTALKMYLDHELTWNAEPTDDEWNGWIDGFFSTAYGEGAMEMKNWFNNFLAMDTSLYESVRGNGSIGKDTLSSDFFPKATLEYWLTCSSNALAALDTSDPNYSVYYNNITLETLSPLYLMLEIYGGELDDVTQFNYASAFVAGVENLGITNIAESVSIEDKINELKSNIATEAEVVFDVDESLALDADKINKIFGTEKTISSVSHGSSELYNNGTLAIGKSGIYNVIVTATDGTQKRVKLHVADEIIETAAEMDAVLYKDAEISGYYVLGNDIDYTGAEYTAYTAGNNGNGFTGIFDGMGYTIRNYAQPNAGANYALFGKLNGATVKNVNFENVTINAWWNSSLFAVYMFNSTVENVTMRNVAFTVNETAGPNGGLLVGSFVQNSVFSNVDIYMGSANNGHLNAVIGDGAYDITAATFEDVNVYNAGEVNLIVRRNSNNAAVYSVYTGLKIYKDAGTTEYEFVNVVETIEEEFIAENGKVTLKSSHFEVGKTYKVDGTTYTATTAGELTVTLSSLTIGEINEVLVTYKNSDLPYNDAIKFKVLAVTQIINDAAEMDVVLYKGTEISGYYVLGNDIDYTGAEYTAYTAGNSGNGFTGIFDGRGFTIRNYAQPNAGAHYVLFGKLNGATVKNVNFENVTVNAWWNSSLFAIYTFSSTIENITMRNVAFTVDSTEGPNGGLLCGYYTDNSVFRNIDIYMGATYNGFVGALLGEGGNTTAETLNDVNVYNVKQDRLQYIVRNQDNVENYAKFTGLTIYTDEGETEYPFKIWAQKMFSVSLGNNANANGLVLTFTNTSDATDVQTATVTNGSVVLNVLVGAEYAVTSEIFGAPISFGTVVIDETAEYSLQTSNVHNTCNSAASFNAEDMSLSFVGNASGSQFFVQGQAIKGEYWFGFKFKRNATDGVLSTCLYINEGNLQAYIYLVSIPGQLAVRVATSENGGTEYQVNGEFFGYPGINDPYVFIRRHNDNGKVAYTIYMSALPTLDGAWSYTCTTGVAYSADSAIGQIGFNAEADYAEGVIFSNIYSANTQEKLLANYDRDGIYKNVSVSLGNNANANGLCLTFTDAANSSDVRYATVENGSAKLRTTSADEGKTFAVTSEIFGAPVSFGTLTVGGETDYALAVSGLHNTNNANATFNAADMSLSYTGNAAGSQFFVQSQAIKGEYWFGFKFKRNATDGVLSTFLFISGSDINAYIYFVSVNGQLALRLATGENGWTDYGSFQYPGVNDPYVFVQRHNNGGKVAYTIYMSATPTLDGAWSYTYTTSVEYSADSAIGQFGFNAEADYAEGVVFSNIYSAASKEELLAKYN